MPPSQIRAGPGLIAVHRYALKTIHNLTHHLFADRVPKQVRAGTSNEGSILKLPGASAHKPVTVGVGREHDPEGISPLRDQQALITSHLSPSFLELSSQQSEKGVLRSDHRRLTKQ